MAALDIDDTIAAIASPPGAGLRGIVRISGPRTIDCISRLFRPDDQRPITDYTVATAITGKLVLRSGRALPGEMLLWPNQKSYTRQPTAEFHTIGSTPLLQLVLTQLGKSGARLAQPGEFTLRAFLSGRIDLTQAEAVLAVIDSSGEQQLATALQQLAGGLAGPLGEIRGQLISTLAELEAGLDFVEEDIEFISPQELTRQLDVARQQLEKIASQISTRDLVADSVKVVLVGLPNSGKSSLFNVLTDSQDAIVTEIPGTTTDFISAKLAIDSAVIELIDTAGFETATQQVPRQAQSHRAEQQDQAQVQLFCIDTTRRLTPWETAQLDQPHESTIVVLTKHDLSDPDLTAAAIAEIQQTRFRGPIVATSTIDLTGLGKLRNQISLAAFESQNSDHSVVSTTVLRAAESLKDAMNSVELALEATRHQRGEEVVAAEIRQALEALGQMVGTVYTDDILDLVFGRFCIGK